MANQILNYKPSVKKQLISWLFKKCGGHSSSIILSVVKIKLRTAAGWHRLWWTCSLCCFTECGPTRVAFGKRCHFMPRFKDDQGLCGNKFAAAESLALFNFRWQFKRKCQSRVRSKHLKKSLKGCTSVLSVLVRMKRISTEVQQLISSHENVHISIKRLKKTCDDATISCLQSQMTLIVSLQSCFICDVEICWIERLE